jgi:hypothetical protein
MFNNEIYDIIMNIKPLDHIKNIDTHEFKDKIYKTLYEKSKEQNLIQQGVAKLVD